MTDNPHDRLRRAAFERFLSASHPIPAMEGHRPSPETLAAVAKAPIARFFPSANRFRKAALTGTTLLSDTISTPDFAVLFADKVRPAIRQAARAGQMLDFGFVPNSVFRLPDNKAVSLPHPYDDWIGIHEWELGVSGYFVQSHGAAGFEAFEIRCVKNPEDRAVLIAGDHAQVRPLANGEVSIATATHIKGLTATECANHASGNVVRPVLFMLMALANSRCTRTPLRKFGLRVNAAPLVSTALDT